MKRAAVVALLALAGCGSKPAPPAVSGPAASCADPSPIAVGEQGPEITGRGRGAQLHGLIMVPRYPIAAGRSTAAPTTAGPATSGAAAIASRTPGAIA
jgi:hypothetical protein